MGCVYMYTNKINGMRYIGQTKRPLKVRHWQHCSQNIGFFDKELKKYGAENFSLEILEDNIDSQEELEEKEVYYIALYDTFNNGYNMTRGGSGGTRFSEEDRDRIIDMIKNTNLPFTKIAEETGYNVYTISDINNGFTLKKDDVEYPIRKRRCSEHFTDDDVYTVIDLLKNTDYSFEKIAELADVNFYFVADINKGKRSFLKDGETTFPIRENNKHCPMTIELASTIIYLLKNEDDKSSEQIADMLHIPGYTVGQVNRGKHSICKQINEEYPIRKKQYKNRNNRGSTKLSDKDVYKIIELLINTNLSTEEISRRYNVDRTAINRINRGASFKNITTQFKLPIRQNSKHNSQIYANSVNE